MNKPVIFHRSLLLALIPPPLAILSSWILASQNVTLDAKELTFILIFGSFFISLLTAGIIWSMINVKNRAIDIAQNFTRELARSENQFKVMSEFSPIGIFLTDVAGQCTYANRSFQELSGLSLAQTKGDGWFSTIHPEDWDKIYQDWTQAVATGSSFENQFRYRRDGAEPLWLKIKVTVVKSSGELTGFLGIVEDITDVRLRDQAFRENEERLTQILSSALDAVVTIDADGNVIGWNPQAESIFGWKREEVMGQSFMDLVFSNRHRDKQREEMLSLFLAGTGGLMRKRIEAVAVHSTGRELPIEISVSPVKYRGTHIFSAFIRDISEKNRAEQLIQERTRNLERLNNLMVDRELRMIELKKEIADLKKMTGESP